MQTNTQLSEVSNVNNVAIPETKEAQRNEDDVVSRAATATEIIEAPSMDRAGVSTESNVRTNPVIGKSSVDLISMNITTNSMDTPAAAAKKKTSYSMPKVCADFI